MASGNPSAKDALLLAQLEALKLDGGSDQEILEVTRELLELRLERDDPRAREALTALESILASGDADDQMLRWYYESCVARIEGNGDQSVTAAERALALAKKLESQLDYFGLLETKSDALLASGRKKEALEALAEAADGFEAAGQPAAAAKLLVRHSLHVDEPEAFGLLKRALKLGEQGDDDAAIAAALFHLGRWHSARDEYLPARHHLDRALELAREFEAEVAIAHNLEELASLELEAYHHDEAIRVATEAVAAALDDGQRGAALATRAMARHRLHDHAGAAADLLEAAAAFEAAGDRDWVEHCRNRAKQDRVLHVLHRLPRWVFRHKDLSSRQAALKRQFNPFLVWVGLLWFLLLVGPPVAAVFVESRLFRQLMFAVTFLALGAMGVVVATAAVLMTRQLWQRWRAARASREKP